MNINNKIIFIHIPKTAGWGIGRRLRELDLLPPKGKGGAPYGHCHRFARDIILEEHSHLPIMTVVRNPYDRLYSVHQFYSKMRADIPANLSFKDFILSFKEKWLGSAEKFHPCYDFITSIDGQILATDILSFHNLEADYDSFCTKYAISNTLIQQNSNPRKQTNIDFKSLYSSEMREVVEEVFQKDLETFKFSYEQFLELH